MMDSEQSPINGAKYNTSIQALRPQTKNLISMLLNPPKIFLSETSLSRDWHGLAQLVGIGGECVPHLLYGLDPTNKILALWLKESKEDATIKKLLMYLEQLDRFDIIDDIKTSIDEDIKIFKQNKTVTPVCIDTTSPEHFILTHDDLKRYEKGLGPQLYDAFILFADDDIDFAIELIEYLEKHSELKVCVKDRDLVPGVLEHESVIKLIAERCNRVVAVFSPTFFTSSSNKFLLSFAQYLGIEQGRRKIIPCRNTYCEIPLEYRCYYMLTRTRIDCIRFWERLKDAI
ncbi:hypothetical protein ILUMI_01529 [Ignelater luminosus]|uniref:Myeloid differentiation primary response protein MyD88 n=1 Tax=Ignelater luminosus TaxID=2038154 RepID=A0A8K0DQJ3_IGNLU|nr:hypothetical protein ILUMI_01529 [Ignelater luminosus]